MSTMKIFLLVLWYVWRPFQQRQKTHLPKSNVQNRKMDVMSFLIVSSFLPPHSEALISVGGMMYLGNNCLFMQVRIIEWWVNDPDQWIFTWYSLTHYRTLTLILSISFGVFHRDICGICKFWIWQIFRVIEFLSTQKFENLDEGTPRRGD